MPLVSPYEKPTRLEALRYYRRVADTPGSTSCSGKKWSAIEREGRTRLRLFRLETRTRRARRACTTRRAVVLAIGYYDEPNLLGVPGEDLPHVSHYYRDAHAYYRQRVVIVGGKNSAAEAALELYRAGAHVTLVHRRPRLGDSIKYWVKPDIENRIKEGSDRGALQHRRRGDPAGLGRGAAGWRWAVRGDPGRRGVPPDGLSRR